MAENLFPRFGLPVYWSQAASLNHLSHLVTLGRDKDHNVLDTWQLQGNPRVLGEHTVRNNCELRKAARPWLRAAGVAATASIESSVLTEILGEGT